MAFKRKYKFSIIDHLYYAGRIRRIHNRWSMPLDAIFLWVFAVVPSLLIIRFLYWVIPLWLPSALSVGLVWAAVEVYSKIEKKYFTKARERAYYRLYPERKDKNYFWLQLLFCRLVCRAECGQAVCLQVRGGLNLCGQLGTERPD